MSIVGDDRGARDNDINPLKKSKEINEKKEKKKKER